MKKKIISVLMTLLMVATIVPSGIGLTNASAADPYDVIIWSPATIPETTVEEATLVKNYFNSLSLNCYSSYGNYSLTQINQLYDLSELKFIMVFLPTTSISSSDISFLDSFLGAGGHIMFVGEHCGFSSNFNNINDRITYAARSLGFNISFSSSYDVDPNDFTISVNSNSDLFKNTTQFSFAAACRITGTDNATEKLSYNNQVCFVGKQIDNGYISVVSDCNIFNYSTESNIKKLLQNCYDIGSNHAHNYESVVTAPTCTAQGYTTYTCTDCGRSYTGNYVNALGHDEAVVSITAPTCTEQGYTTYTCTDCGYTYRGTYVNALGHDIGVRSITEPTCTTDGVKVVGCSRCDVESITVLLNSSTYPKSSHNYSNNMSQIYNFSYPGADKLILTFSASTRFENSYDYLYIYDHNGSQIGKYTGSTLASKVITINGDSFKLKLTSDHSVTEYGFSFSKIEAYTVGSYTEVLPATGHTEVVIPAVAATCSTTGLTEGKRCNVCGDITVEPTVVDALGHSEEVIPGVAATCEQTGLTDGKKCSVCGEITVEQTVVEALGHNEVIIPGVEATCEKSGLTEGKKCSVCGEITVEQTVVEAHEHNEVIIPAVKATCTKTGLTEGKKCSVCNKTIVEQKVVKKVPHSETVLKAVPASCNKSGLTEGKKCSACGEILIEQKMITPIAHTRVTVAGKAPTCLEDGYTDSVKCSVCNEILVKPSVLKASHSKTTIPAKAPTCAETGLSEGVKCSLCNEILVEQSVVEKTDHIDENIDGYCDTCSVVVDQSIIEANCECRCHDNDFFFKIILFFQKLFGINRYCVCGKSH